MLTSSIFWTITYFFLDKNVDHSSKILPTKFYRILSTNTNFMEGAESPDSKSPDRCRVKDVEPIKPSNLFA